MKFNMGLLKLVAMVLFVVAAILFFAEKSVSVGMGLTAVGLAAWMASDVKM